MKSQFLKILFILTFAALPALAGDGPVSGVWKINGSVSGVTIDMTCKINQEEKKLTGSCKSDQVAETAVTGEVADKKVQWKFNTDYNGMSLTLVFNGTLDDKASNMSGKIDVQPVGIEGDFSAKKEEPKKDTPKSGK